MENKKAEKALQKLEIQKYIINERVAKFKSHFDETLNFLINYELGFEASLLELKLKRDDPLSTEVDELWLKKTKESLSRILALDMLIETSCLSHYKEEIMNLYIKKELQ